MREFVAIVESPDEEQEGLTNVARHARATTVWVHLGEQAGAVVLEVDDDGVGISPAQLAEPRSPGLPGMRERAAAFGGAIEIAGAPGQGATVMVRMPVFVPRIKNLPGFLAYYLVGTGEGIMASVSVFETKGGADESNRMAASWVKESLSGLLGPVEITASEAVAHATVGELVAH